MRESSPINPYAAPDDAETFENEPMRRRKPSYNVFLLCLGFAVVKGIGAGFGTMILLVYLSGTSVRWENATPLLIAALVICLGLHGVEWFFRFPLRLAWMLGLLGYGCGSVVVTMAGMIGLFPNPFF